jgi:hypothetical protein
VVERGGLENRCGRFRPPWVRIPPPPLSRAERPVVAGLSCGSGYGRRDAALPLKTVQTAGRGCRMSLIVTVGRPWSPAGATNTAHRLPRVARVDRLRGAHELLGPKASYRPLLGELAEALVGEVDIATTPPLNKYLSTLAQTHHGLIVIDLRQLTFLDSTASRRWSQPTATPGVTGGAWRSSKGRRRSSASLRSAA